MNKWFAECVPHKWEMRHDEQDAAISAAEQHVLDEHRDLFSLPGDVRSRQMSEQRIGHVQLRDENAIAAGVSTGAPAPAESIEPAIIDEELAHEEAMLAKHAAWVADLRAKKVADRREQS